MKKIKLAHSNKVAIIDDGDFDLVSRYKWHLSSNKNGARTSVRTQGLCKVMYMHRLIMGNPIRGEVDHVNHDKLDNRKSNLRICTHSQNQWNYSKPRNNTSGFKGVYWHNYGKKWAAQIKVFGKRLHLGLFNSKIKAKIAYNKAALKYFKEFALLN